MSNPSQYCNVQPLSKKPKLDIERQVNSSSFRYIESECPRKDKCKEIYGGKVHDTTPIQIKSNTVKEHSQSSENSASSQCTVGDMYEELWGDDLDSEALEKVEFEETMALSQVSI